MCQSQLTLKSILVKLLLKLESETSTVRKHEHIYTLETHQEQVVQLN
jgi:hypothetical protein